MPAINPRPEEHFARLARLLDMEAEAEKLETLRELERHTPAEAEALGNSLINLVIRDEDCRFGRTVPVNLWQAQPESIPAVKSPADGQPCDSFGRR